MATTRRGSAEVEVRFVDRFTREVRQAARTTEDDLKRSRQRNRRAAEDAAKDDARPRSKPKRDSRATAGDMMDFGRSVAAATKAPIDTYIDFEKQMDSVAASTFDMTQAMDAAKTREMNAAVAELSKTARVLGADTRFSASQAAEGMDILAKNFAGEDLQKAQDVMAAMPGILDTAAATKESIADAADVSSAAMNQFGLQAKDMGLIGDILVKTANSSATGLIDLGEALKYSGVTAHKAGVDLATTTAMLGALGNAGKKGSVAGTGLASVLGNIQSGAKKQKSALAALGIDVKDKQGNLKPVVDLLAEMQKAADKKFGVGKGGVRRDRWLQGLVGMGGDKEALAILMQQAGSGELQKLIKMNREAEGTAKAVAAAMNDNAAGAADELSGAYEELQLTIGEAVIPVVTDLLKGTKDLTVTVAGFAKENPELVKSLGMVAAAIAAVGVATSVVNTIMAANKWVIIITAVATAAGLIYQYWEPITTWFGENWRTMATAIGLVMPPIGLVVAAAGLIMENWEPIKEFFKGLWDVVTGSFTTAMNWILDKIDWVGAKIEAFKISTMSDEELEAYQKQQAEAARAASAEAIDQEDLSGLASVTGRGGVGDYGSGLAAAAQKDNTAAAISALQGWWETIVPTAAASNELVPNDAVREAWANLQNENLQPARAKEVALGKPVVLGANVGRTPATKNELKVTFDPVTGQVTKTSLKGDDNPDFVVRANAGAQ